MSCEEDQDDIVGSAKEIAILNARILALENEVAKRDTVLAWADFVISSYYKQEQDRAALDEGEK
jgi:hypothetical protein